MKKYLNGTTLKMKDGKVVTIKCQPGDEFFNSVLSWQKEGFLDTTDYMNGRGRWWTFRDVNLVVSEPQVSQTYQIY